MLRLTRTRNGVYWQEDSENDAGTPAVLDWSYAIDDDKTGEVDLEKMQEFLYSVAEWYGYYGSKHDKRRLFIRIEDQNAE